MNKAFSKKIIICMLAVIILFVAVLFVNLTFTKFTVTKVNNETKICTMETHHGKFLLDIEESDIGVEAGDTFFGTCPMGGDPNTWGYEGSEHSPD